MYMRVFTDPLCLYNVFRADWCWVISWVCSSLEECFSCSQHVLVACCSFCVVRASELPHVLVGMSVVVLVPLMFRQSCWREFMGVAAVITETQSQNKLPDPLALPIFPHPIPPCSLTFRCWGVLLTHPLVLRSWLYFDWLQFSVVVSVCCKERFLHEEWRLQLSVGGRTNVARLLLRTALL